MRIRIRIRMKIRINIRMKIRIRIRIQMRIRMMFRYVATRWYRAPEIMLNWMHYKQTGTAGGNLPRGISGNC